jgi:hypothetical protein
MWDGCKAVVLLMACATSPSICADVCTVLIDAGARDKQEPLESGRSLLPLNTSTAAPVIHTATGSALAAVAAGN